MLNRFYKIRDTLECVFRPSELGMTDEDVCSLKELCTPVDIKEISVPDYLANIRANVLKEITAKVKEMTNGNS